MKFLLKVMLLIYMCMQAAVAAHVIVDAGHGGADKGASYTLNGQLYHEKDIVLDVAKQVERELSSQGHRVLMTRTGDQAVSLNERLEKSRRYCENLFMSIHADAFKGSDKVNGATVLVRNYRNPRSVQVAKSVQRALNPKRSIRAEALRVLRNENSRCASVLVELGFMSNPEDLSKLVDAQYRKGTAQQLVKAIAPYLKENRAIKPSKPQHQIATPKRLPAKTVSSNKQGNLSGLAKKTAKPTRVNLATSQKTTTKIINKKIEIEAKLTPSRKAVKPLVAANQQAGRVIELKKETTIIAKK